MKRMSYPARGYYPERRRPGVRPLSAVPLVIDRRRFRRSESTAEEGMIQPRGRCPIGATVSVRAAGRGRLWMTRVEGASGWPCLRDTLNRLAAPSGNANSGGMCRRRTLQKDGAILKSAAGAGLRVPLFPAAGAGTRGHSDSAVLASSCFDPFVLFLKPTMRSTLCCGCVWS